MATQLESIINLIRQGFSKQLEGPGVTWNKQGMILQLELAIGNALIKSVEDTLNK